MRHFVLTRSAYDPNDWPEDANQRRLDLFRGITARSLAAQTQKDWTWAIVLHPEDPFRGLRAQIAQAAAPAALVLYLQDAVLSPQDAALVANRSYHAREAAAVKAYRGDWARHIDAASGAVLTTRIDDDDAFAPDALERVRHAADRRPRRAFWELPVGYRIFDGRYDKVRHETNAWVSLLTEDGDDAVVYDYLHRKVRSHGPVRFVDSEPAWLWVRHPDTLSGHKQAGVPIDSTLQALFPIDWDLLPEPATTEGVQGKTAFR